MIAGRVVGERRASPAPMSALGQKQTFAVQKGMSALPPIATLIAHFGVSAGHEADKRPLTKCVGY